MIARGYRPRRRLDGLILQRRHRRAPEGVTWLDQVGDKRIALRPISEAWFVVKNPPVRTTLL